MIETTIEDLTIINIEEGGNSIKEINQDIRTKNIIMIHTIRNNILNNMNTKRNNRKTLIFKEEIMIIKDNTIEKMIMKINKEGKMIIAKIKVVDKIIIKKTIDKIEMIKIKKNKIEIKEKITKNTFKGIRNQIKIMIIKKIKTKSQEMNKKKEMIIKEKLNKYLSLTKLLI
jgi:hypothetical protein